MSDDVLIELDAVFWREQARAALKESAELASWSLELLALAVGPDLLDRVHAVAETAARRAEADLARAQALDPAVQLGAIDLAMELDPASLSGRARHTAEAAEARGERLTALHAPVLAEAIVACGELAELGRAVAAFADAS
jgi:hypothetical protein